MVRPLLLPEAPQRAARRRRPVLRRSSDLHIHDCLSSRGIRDDIARNVPLYENGHLTPNDGPGLGIEL
ncbi:hypothetical protein LLG90_27545, partial [Aromatoleum toluclasticum]|nr:hypothetical protein [Aromatoleum toluclasticum]